MYEPLDTPLDTADDLERAYEAPTEDPTGEPSGLDAEGLDDDPSEDTGLLGQPKDSDSLLGPL